jgi:hypothetical protein
MVVNNSMEPIMINILSCDPGSINFGFSVLTGRIQDGEISFKVVANGMCPCPLKRVKKSKDLRDQQVQFQLWFENLIFKHNIDAVCAERFMARGLLGPLGEYIGIMLGMMGLILIQKNKKPLKIFPAATWKNAVRRNADDKEFLDKTYKIAKVPPHQLDASLMGVWTLYQGYNRTDFEGLDLVQIRDKLLDQIEATSETKLINRKIKR